MFEEIKKESLYKILAILLIAAVGIYLLRIVWQVFGTFSDILIILIISWLLSFILEPIVEKIHNISHIPKTISAIITYVIMAGLFGLGIFLLIPIVSSQVETLSKILPSHLQSAPQFVSKWSDTLISSLNNSFSVISSVAQFLFSIFIILILSFYFVIEKDLIHTELFSFIPKKWHQNTRFFLNAIDTSFASFLRVQLLFGVISGIITWIVLKILGVDFAAFASLLSGIFAIIPLVGPILAIIPPILVAFITDPGKAVIAFAILLIAQQVIFNVVGPKLFSKAFKLDPIIILISFLVGGKIAGTMGAIFAIPVLGIIAVVAKKLWRHYLEEK